MDIIRVTTTNSRHNINSQKPKKGVPTKKDKEHGFEWLKGFNRRSEKQTEGKKCDISI
jgi:hypothetical protein